MSEYKLIRELGKGGMGCVWYGMRDDGVECAIKCMLAKYVSIPDYREFFDSEAHAMKRLNHPSVVKIMGDTFTDSKGNLYLPMEYIQGETIEQHIKRTGLPFQEDEVIRIMSDVLDTFSYIHEQGQIHRDIKPSNIMLRPDGHICVIDFGIAKDMKISTGKTVGRQVGTSGYMSPEQISALNIDHRTDIYSLGCLLFYMLTAQHAITKRSNDFETMRAIQQDSFPSVRAINPTVSKYLEDVIYKATDKDMRRRYQTAADFKQALFSPSNITVKTSICPPVSDLKKLTGCWTITVGRKGQDINIPNEYVSFYHLDIELIAQYITREQNISRTLTLTDHSTNGTGVNGKYIRNAKITIPFDILQESTHIVPDILLAGRESCRLDWLSICDMLQEKMARDIRPEETTDDQNSDEPESEEQDSLSYWTKFWHKIIETFN